jgi:hypothetical protein
VQIESQRPAACFWRVQEFNGSFHAHLRVFDAFVNIQTIRTFVEHIPEHISKKQHPITRYHFSLFPRLPFQLHRCSLDYETKRSPRQVCIFGFLVLVDTPVHAIAPTNTLIERFLIYSSYWERKAQFTQFWFICLIDISVNLILSLVPSLRIF